MAVEIALNFMKYIIEQEAIQSKLAEQIGDAEALLRIAAESGFTFTVDEWNEAVSYVRAAELTESDLDAVAGGTYSTAYCGLSVLNTHKCSVGGGSTMATLVCQIGPYGY